MTRLNFALCLSLALLPVVTSSTCRAENEVKKEKVELIDGGFRMAKPWGGLEAKGKVVELRVSSIPADRQLLMPRLNNRMKSLTVKGADELSKQLKFKPLLVEWQISLPKGLKDVATPTIVFETLEPVYLPTKPRHVKPLKSGEIVLAAHDVVTHGRLLRFARYWPS